MNLHLKLADDIIVKTTRKTYHLIMCYYYYFDGGTLTAKVIAHIFLCLLDSLLFMFFSQ